MGKLDGNINNFPSVRFLKTYGDALVKVDISLGFVIYVLNIPLGFIRIIIIFPLGFIKNCYICR